MSEKFFILRRTLWDIIINVYWSSYKVPVILADANGTWILSTGFQKIIKRQTSWETFQWELRFLKWRDRRTDGRTGMTKLIAAFVVLRTHLNFMNKQTENSCRINFCVLKFTNVIKGQIFRPNSQVTFHRAALLGTDTTPGSRFYPDSRTA